jgi:hypothetical protein
MTLAREEGFELNLLGLTFGVDVAEPALKLPMVGRLGDGEPIRVLAPAPAMAAPKAGDGES